MATSDRSQTIQVHGAKELRRAIKNAEGDLKAELKKANKDAALEVAQAAKARHVPVDSGNLKKAITALGSATKGQVKAGKKSKNTQDYAGVVHYGDPKRGREPQPFLHEAASEKWEQVREAYEKALGVIAETLSTK